MEKDSIIYPHEENHRKRRKKKSRQKDFFAEDSNFIEPGSVVRGYHNKNDVSTPSKDSSKKKKHKHSFGDNGYLKTSSSSLKNEVISNQNYTTECFNISDSDQKSKSRLPDKKKKMKLVDENMLDNNFPDREFNHRTLITKKKCGSSNKLSDTKLPTESMKSHVKQEPLADWQTVTEFIQTANYGGSIDLPKNNYHYNKGQNVRLPSNNNQKRMMQDHEITMEDYIDTISEKAKRIKKNKKHKNKAGDIESDPEPENSSIEHQSDTIPRKKTKNQKNIAQECNNLQIESMKSHVKQELTDWQAVTEFAQTANYDSSIDSPKKNYHNNKEQNVRLPSNKNQKRLMYDHEMTMEDYIDTISEKAKRIKKNKKHKNKARDIETDPNEQLLSYLNTALKKEMPEPENSSIEHQSDTMPRKKTKNQKNIVQEYTPILYNSSESDQFMRSDFMKEKVTTTTRKRKKKLLDEWDYNNVSEFDKPTSKKKRRKLGDISISGILNDYVQCVKTQPGRDRFTSTLENSTPISEEYKRHDFIHSDCDYFQEKSISNGHITSGDNADISSERLKIEDFPEEIDQEISYSDTHNLNGDMVFESKEQIIEPQRDPIMKKKSKKKKKYLKLFDDISMLGQSSIGETVEDESISTMPRNKMSEYSDIDDRKLLDISFSSVSNDLEQFNPALNIETKLEEHSSGDNFGSNPCSSAPILQKYHRYYSVYNSDCDAAEEIGSPKTYMRGTFLKDYISSSDDAGNNGTKSKNPVISPQKCKESSMNTDKRTSLGRQSISIEDHTFPKEFVHGEKNNINSKTRKSSVETSYSSDSNYSDELTMPADISRKETRSILDHYKTSKNGICGEEKLTAKKKHGNNLEITEYSKKKTTPKKTSVSVQSNTIENYFSNELGIVDNENVNTKRNKHSIEFNDRTACSHETTVDSNKASVNEEKSELDTSTSKKKKINSPPKNKKSEDIKKGTSPKADKNKRNLKELVNETIENIKEESDTECQKINDPGKDESTGNFRLTRNMKYNSARGSDEFDKEIIKNLTIFLPFVIPPLHHNILYRTRPTIPNIDIKSGAFSKNEDNMIMNNWKQFCEEHNLDIKPCAFFHFRGWKTEEKIKFLQYISHGLDDRLPQRVHARFKKIYENMYIKQGRFSRDEDKQILSFMDKYGDSEYPFANLAKILNRNNLSVLKRYEILRNANNNDRKIVWTIEDSDRLVRRMMKIGKCEKIEDLENIQLSTEQWQKLSRKLHIPLKKLHRGWEVTVHPRLFSKNDLLGVKKRVFKLLQDKKANDWRAVDWTEIAKNFVGYTPQKVYNLFRTLVNFHVPRSKQRDLGECLRILNETDIKKIKKLRRFVFKDGHLKYEDQIEEDD